MGNAESSQHGNTEQLVLTLWARVLERSPGKIGKDDDFFELGGDITKAMQLSRVATEHGLPLTAKDILRNPNFYELCNLAHTRLTSPAPASATGTNIEDLRSYIARSCDVHEPQVLDAYPCTPLQAGFLALTARGTENYVSRNIYEIGSGVSKKSIRRAWDQVVAMNPILRTRIVTVPRHGLMQAVLEEGVSWSFYSNFQEYCAQTEQRPVVGLDSPLMRFAFIEADKEQRRYFVWEIHHALYDGWSLSLLLREAEDAYYGRDTPALEPMTTLMQYIADIDGAITDNFWRTQFVGLQGIHFPPPPNADYHPQPSRHVNLAVKDIMWDGSDFTPATVIRAAWAVVLAHCAGSSEALFGVTVTGRQAPVPGIECMAGPAIATVPVRVCLNWEENLLQFLSAVQQQVAEMIPFEQAGLQRIRSMSKEAATACEFQSLLVVQPPKDQDCNDVTDGQFLKDASGIQEEIQPQEFSTYSIVMECQLEERGLQLSIGFDPNVVTTTHMKVIVQNFERMLRHFESASRGRTQKLGIVVEEDLMQLGLDDVWTWNATAPEATESCIHDLIARCAYEAPSLPAICAWDGNLTYIELDSLSTNLASELMVNGASGSRVALFFEKSMWMSVAAMAVIKAGGTLLPIDTTQPEERLRGMIEKAASRLALTSVHNENLARILSPAKGKVMVIGEERHSAVAIGTNLATVSPESVLYVVFTSGSTGEPKGVMVTHRNFSSAITHQQEMLGFTKHSRVMDFASYAFDVAWSNMLHTLTAGGCLCIPSEDERQNDLAMCLDKYQINTIDLTPSLARTLEPTVLSKLSTLILGGEEVLPSDALLAGKNTRVINAYGPAECSPTSTLADMTTGTAGIGHGLGVCTWVVQPDNPDLLAPVGSVGELWIEGPLVGQGYLGDPRATAKAFIKDPKWLLRGVTERLGHSKRPGRSGRVYRTGDLVKYTQDGSLIFVGRNDAQVKIRGQRVELSEVAHHARREICGTLGADGKSINVQVVAEVIQPRRGRSNNALLVVFVSFGTGDGAIMTEEQHSESVKQASKGLTDRMARVLPAYMVPEVFIPVRQIPITPAGKTDVRQLREIGVAAWMKGLSNSEERHPTDSLSDIEGTLQRVWMSVLNLSAGEVSIDKAFTRIGGDSITAMQVVAQCRLHSITITVSEVLKASTIRNLAPLCRTSSTQVCLAADDAQDTENGASATGNDTPFDMSPIQQMFFEAFPDGINHFNQMFVLELRRPVAVETLREALQLLVNRHAMLRARFRRDDKSGIWKQFIFDGDDAFAFEEHDMLHRVQITKKAQWRQEHLDIVSGPVFACDIFRAPNGEQTLVLTAHHLVVDLVSWRIIWNDITDYVDHGKLRSVEPPSFRRWCRLQAQASRNSSPLSVLPFTVPKPQLEYWGLPIDENTSGDVDVHAEIFESSTTKLLFSDSNESMRTEPIDILIGALIHSFAKVFPERSPPVVWIEGHGRELSEDVALDMSGTVGWFTTVYPLPISINPHNSIFDAIRLAKDTRLRIPGKGRPYFACRYHSVFGREVLQGHDVVELTVNFSGSYQQLESEEGLFKRPGCAQDEELGITEVSSATRRFSMIDVMADLQHGQLVVSFHVHKRMKHRPQLTQWSEEFGDLIESVAQELQHRPATLTLGDIPLLPLSYSSLDTLLKQHYPSLGIDSANVADIYPCSPLQEGILLSAAKGDATYATISIWRCISLEGSATRISVPRLEEAWKIVVSRHSILSTIFTLHPGGNGFIQTVLLGVKPCIVRKKSGKETPSFVLERMDPKEFAANEPQHAFTICVSKSGEVACRLDISHAMVDAASMSVILSDLVAHYDGLNVLAAPPFKEVIQHIESVPKSQRLAAWKGLLDGVQPCIFTDDQQREYSSPSATRNENLSEVSVVVPSPSKITELCRKIEITRSVFLQVAWAMVLAHFTSMQDVCFGYMSSGRDAPIDGIDRMVGPLANLLVARIDLREPARKVLQATSKTSIAHMAMQNVSLAELYHELNLSGQRLFNTSLSIKSSEKVENSRLSSIELQPHTGTDFHEFDLSLNATIEGENMEVSLGFRQPYFGRQGAEEASWVLTRAISYLLEAVSLPSPDNDTSEKSASESDPSILEDSLCGGFFRDAVGADMEAARCFWQHEFSGIIGSHFPPFQTDLSPETKHDRRETTVTSTGFEWDDSGFSVETAMRGAWSIVAARHTESNEALFGIWTGVFGSVVPVRVALDWDASTGRFLSGVQRCTEAMKPFHRTDLQWIRHLGPEAALGCNFQAVLHISELPDSPGRSTCSSLSSMSKYERYTMPESPLMVECQIESGGDVTVSAEFSTAAISELHTTRVLHQFIHVLRQLCSIGLSEKRLCDVSILSPHDLQNIWIWNDMVEPAVDACVHHLIMNQASKQPRAQAVNAWDGSLTYGQVDQTSTQLALRLIEKGLKQGDIVPLCFEKSMWMPVAAIAVMKAGGTCFALDSGLPEERLRNIMAQVKSDIVLTSSRSAALARRLGVDEVLVVEAGQFASTRPTLLRGRGSVRHADLPIVKPRRPLYVVFTSGSTGIPKGVIITHQNFCSAIVYQRDAQGFCKDSRVLDFASYTFDAAWSNLLFTLTAGGCLCIPSQTERENDIAGCLDKYRITLVDLTPSVARSVEPRSALSKLSTLLLGGEAVMPTDAQLAGAKTPIKNIYGPAECTPTSTIAHLSGTDSVTMGRGAGLCTWVVEPTNPQVLTPIGAVGELCLEGPLVGRGYLGDADKTAAAFLEDPTWLLRGVPGKRPGRCGRVYRTGDLVRYGNADGSLIFVGRKDTQVKIRGQRVELGEVEHHIKHAIKHSPQDAAARVRILAETIPQSHGCSNSQGEQLIAFIALENAKSTVSETEHASLVRQMMAITNDRLTSMVPSYMIPKLYIPITDIPLMASGKVDRRQLRELASSLAAKEIEMLSCAEGGPRQAPQSKMERLVQGLWAEVLGLDPDSISSGDSFFRLGGDSLRAMQLAAKARQNGLFLTVRDIFKNPILRDISALDV
ncbi:non-ribosomal peptide synthetase [Xylariales sp. PMI_506]|nr:non-ribosomal peptide synthetase [Xylariales sp. PMI_506]